MAQYIKVNGEWVAIQARYKKVNGVWVQVPESGFPELSAYVFGGSPSEVVSIAGLDSVSAVSSSYCALLNGVQDVTTGSTWSVVSGSNYATIDQLGELTILSGADNSNVTIQVEHGTSSARKTVSVTYVSGATAYTETEIVVDAGGNTSTTTTTTIENNDGSTTSESTTVEIDASGNTLSRTTGTTQTNSDGSFTGTTTTYNSEGEPSEGTNVSGDVEGNVSTQQVGYDESGGTMVTGYEIDTTGSGGEGKEFDGDGVNTEFVPFCDDNCGFVCHMKFTTVMEEQERPPHVPDVDDSGSNYLYNIMSAKSPFKGTSSWPGFEIRWAISKTDLSASGNSLQFRYSSAGATSTTSRKMNGKNDDGTATGHTYDITITYDPQMVLPTSRNTFSVTSANGCISSIGTDVTFESTDIDFTIGYTNSTQGTKHRFSNMVIHDFNITKICSTPLVNPDEPEISCDGEHVTITCETEGASIYYRLNQTGNYLIYSSPITINTDTVVQAYSEFMGMTSNIVTENCIYNNGVARPVITCDGEEVVITCETVGASIYYRLNETGSFGLYSVPIAINADTIVEAYAQLSNKTSPTVSKNCRVSHDYSEDYLTFKVITSGDVVWRTAGSGAAKTIEYSINDGSWTSITSTTAGVSVPVSAGDEVRFRGSNNAYSVDKSNFSAFSGGTATYDIQGNAMSLLYGDSFTGQTTLPATWALSNVFNTSRVVSAENLVLPATAITSCGYRAMFANCPNLTTAPELPATTLAASAYTYMFDHCVSMTVGPELLAATVPGNCYTGMFHDCQLLNYIKCLATNISATDCLKAWVEGVAVTGTFVKDINTNWSVGINGIPTGWVIQEEGAANPVISCDGVSVTIVSDTTNADIYYRLNQSGSYSAYTYPISITADTVVQAYAELDGRASAIVSQTCVFDDGVHAPVISSNGKRVTMTCDTAGASIYYRLGSTGNYESYTAAVPITADTVVYAYAELNGDTSVIVSESCTYDPSHDYSEDYLAFKVLTSGTIGWKAYGSLTKTIEYSINDSAWTSITSTSAGATIPVSQGDTVRVRGSNTAYATSKSAYSGFDGGTAVYNVEGNIMSLVNGDNFSGTSALTGTYNFCSLFKQSNIVSAENLILPTAVLTNYCYRAMFSFATSMVKAPALPATTLAQGCYWYMFESCPISEAPELKATTLVRECYGNMFANCSSLVYIKCLATTSLNVTSGLTNWVSGVSATGTFVKESGITWSTGLSGIPAGWVVYENEAIYSPAISFDGDIIEITCQTAGADIYYRLDETGNYSLYTTSITITADTIVQTYSTFMGQTSPIVRMVCEKLSDVPLEYSNRSLGTWTYNGQDVQTPYSVNRIDGHSSAYLKGTFNFEASFNLRESQPAHLWFQHADQSAAVYVDNTLVEKHWGGYTSFFVDISEHVHQGTNHVKVALKNNEGDYLAPATGDFNYNATLGEVKLYTSPVLPSTDYGYDGFHVVSNVCATSATVTVKTSVPTGATVVCTIDDGTYHFSDSGASTNTEMQFNATISGSSLHLWSGTADPHLYTITLEIYYNGDLYHRFQRPYGLRYYRYYIGDDPNMTYNGVPYTGFTLNGQPYFLRGVCMHDDLEGKANALTAADYTQEFAIIQELGCNFIRLAHYPHPKEVYDWCDRLGIVVQTEAPCVNKFQSTMPADYYEHLSGQYDDMVRQHYNHPCIMFWGLSNETTTNDKTFAKAKIEQYTAQIKALDSERLVGYVMSHSWNNPVTYYNNPSGVDWFGCNIYVGWYIDKTTNDPTSQITTRVNNVIKNAGKAMAFSEYGCGGTQRCHSENFTATTTTGNYERHDIEYQMWLHEGHIASIRNFPQLLFTAEWQLFDIAVANRNEGYTVCLDGVNTSTDDNLRRLNNKGLVERDHRTKKDTFYIYKAEWNPTDKFVHICGKEYTKTTGRVIKCYTNDGSSLDLYVNNTKVETVTVTDHIAEFTPANYSSGDVIRVEGSTTNDTLTFS